jgi:S1-C subfamily serine protease
MNKIDLKVFSKIALVCIILLILTIDILSLFNIFRWADRLDYGKFFRSSTGIKVVGGVTTLGRKAGIQLGDRILKVNGETYNSIQELLSIINSRPGSQVIFSMERSGRHFEVTVNSV